MNFEPDYQKWKGVIDKYSDIFVFFRMGDDLGHKTSTLLVLEEPEIVYRTILEQGMLFRGAAKGYGLGFGNSIPEYIPVDGFMAMIEAVKEIRRRT